MAWAVLVEKETRIVYYTVKKSTKTKSIKTEYYHDFTMVFTVEH